MTPSYAGQIVRINLENFMRYVLSSRQKPQPLRKMRAKKRKKDSLQLEIPKSYDNIEIHPGNHLNLIIGPNGTGKSSIVCAVLLGLGGKLKTLGRADQLGSYVKSGCDQCCIELELYESGGKNVIIKRKILSNNQSEFIVNGKVSTAQKVNEIRRKYNIQIDNLCTFLPQEKVQDFAKLNPQQLLDQTQRTVGNGDLVQLHEELRKLQSKAAEEEKCILRLQDDIENEKQKNDRLKDKIKCFKEKQSLCDKLVVLKQKKAWMYYEQEIKNKEEIDKDFKLAERLFNTKRQEIDQLNKTLQRLESSLESYKKKLSDAKKDEAGKKQLLEEWIKRAERRIESLEDLRQTVQAKLNEQEEKKKEMLNCKRNVEKLTNDLQTLDSDSGSESDLNAKKEEVDRQMKCMHDEEARLIQAKVDLVEDEETLCQHLRNASRECERLKKRQNIRLEYLKRNEPDVYKSIEWLEKNRNLFQSRIYNPMLLELDVPNSKMAKYVEAVVAYRDLISFTCTNPDDLNLLVQKLRAEQKLKVNAICSDEYDNSQYFPDIPISDLRAYGFNSYIKDLLTGPEDIIRFLCKTYRIHCVPVGDESVKSNCHKVPQSISSFYSENDVFLVKYSVYSGDKSITVKKLDEAKFFGESVDEGRMQILLESQKEIQNKIKSKQAEIKGIDERLNKLRAAVAEVKKMKLELGTYAEKRQQIQKNLKRAIASYNSIKETLKDSDEIEEEANRQRETLKREIQKNLSELKQSSEDFEKTKLIRQTCELKYKINTFEKNQVLENKAQCMEELSRKETILRDVRERQKSAEVKCLQLKEKAKQLTDHISKEDREFKKFREKFSELPDSVDDLESAIVETQTKADFLQGGNYQILQDYEKREELIARLTEALDRSKRNLQENLEELNSKQDDWLNPVNELISNINTNFGRFFEAMGCAGEVSLISGENKSDFDQYGIKILVKFRDGTPLQELGRYFQSGGERAVATAIFMLSLQELTSVPFRFVDEINQGMDPENERRILQLIITVTASKRSNQYFFITPKLLPELECSQTMTVLCIYNGLYAIPATEWDMNKFLNISAPHSDAEDDDEDSS